MVICFDEWLQIYWKTETNNLCKTTSWLKLWSKKKSFHHSMDLSIKFNLNACVQGHLSGWEWYKTSFHQQSKIYFYYYFKFWIHSRVNFQPIQSFIIFNTHTELDEIKIPKRLQWENANWDCRLYQTKSLFSFSLKECVFNWWFYCWMQLIYVCRKVSGSSQGIWRHSSLQSTGRLTIVELN